MKELHSRFLVGMLRRCVCIGLVALLAAGTAVTADSPGREMFADGFVLLKAGKPKEAAVKFESGLKLDPNNALAYFYLGEAYSAQGELDKARKAYYQSLAIDLNSQVAAQAQQRVASLSGQMSQAPKPAAAAPLPPSTVAAVRAVPAPNIASEVASPKPSTKVKPVVADDNADALAELVDGNHSFDARDWSAAEVHFRKALQALPDTPKMWGRLCHAQVMVDHFSEALETCQRASTQLPSDAEVFENIGFSLVRLGKQAESIQWYQKAIDIAPDSLAPYSGIAAAQFSLRNWAKAEEWYKQVVIRNPKDQSAWQTLGYAASELGRGADAVGYYRKAVDLADTNAETYRALGYQLYLQDRFSEAASALSEADRLNPKDASTLVSLGAVIDKLGKAADARSAWQRASALDPNGEAGSIARKNLVNR